ncbi:NepR family anti-sigma factor [Neotabrizicola sp. sgz301269]|uniref:NepR family anti-sigma factor n=1 Tax=Neotabrizicola sp. sgz301269 TaxID=3276282 RepID=UPI00376F6743
MNEKMQQSRSGKGVINAEMKAQIDENLKRVYQDALSEEVPDRFKDLLAQLQAKDAQK